MDIHVYESVMEKEMHLVCHWIADKMAVSIWLMVVEEKKTFSDF